MSPVILDRAGMFVSALCLIHCMAFPILVLMMPGLSAVLFSNETLVHILLLGLALPVSFLAFRHGYKHHKDRVIVILGMVGLLLLVLGVTHVFGEESEVMLTIPGAILLFAAHLRNWVYHRSHQHDHGHAVKEEEAEIQFEEDITDDRLVNAQSSDGGSKKVQSAEI